MRLSAETVRRGLHRMEFVWRPPRPVVGPRDRDYETKLRKIRRLLDTLPCNGTAVFQDEVDAHLNRKVFSHWKNKGVRTI